MNPSIRSRIQHAVNNLSYREDTSLPKIRELAMLKGNVQWEQMTDFSTASSSVAKSGRKAGSKPNLTMHIGGPTSDLGIPSRHPKPYTSQPIPVLDDPHASNRAHDPFDMVHSFPGLAYVLSITGDKIEEAVERNKLHPISIIQTIHELPRMTNEHLYQAMSVIPGDYWFLSFWTCCKPGHVTFPFRPLSLKRSVFFECCYNVHQVSINAQMKAWLKQKIAYSQGIGPSKGLRSGIANYFSERGRGRGGGDRGMGRGLDNGYRMQQRSQSSLPAPLSNAGALPAPTGARQTQQPGQVAFMKENSEFSSS